MKKIISLLLISTFSLPVLAQADIQKNNQTAPAVSYINQHSGFYLGAGYGQTIYGDFGYDDEKDEYTNNTLDLEADGSAMKVYTGYHFNRIVGVEVSYNHYGDLKTSSSSDLNGKLSPTSIAVSANLGFTFDNGLRPFAITGLSSVDLQPSQEWLKNDSVMALHFGIGGEYSPPTLKGLSFRFAYEGEIYNNEIDKRYTSTANNTDHNSVLGLWYLGVGYQF